MKYTSFLFAFVFILSTVVSYSIDTTLFKRSMHITVENDDLKDLNKECIQDLTKSKEFEECINGISDKNVITKDNYEKVCTAFNSDKCQNFIKNPMKSLNNCKDTIISQILDESMIKSLTSYMSIICSKDESNKICPMGDLYISGQIAKGNLTSVLNNTCRSRKCIDITVKALTSSLDNSIDAEELSIVEGEVSEKEENNVNTMVNFLNSDNCKAMVDSTSNAFSIKLSIISIIICGLILLLI